jgi:hypothetical protein
MSGAFFFWTRAANPTTHLEDSSAVCASAGEPRLIARAAVEPHLRVLLSSDDPKPVVLNLVEPFAA